MRHDQRLAPEDPSAQDRAAAFDSKTAATTNQPSGVLIVEDDFLIGMQSESALADAGFRVVGIANTAEEAVALAKKHQPRLALMDVRLAGRRDGVDAAGELYRELGIRCVFATAHDDRHMRGRAEPFAPLGWLTKPYTMASLVAIVKDAISKVG
jgi:DNA-binding NarL/FixJ family response regulator